MSIKSLLQNIFSIRNEDSHKIISIFGIKFKIKRNCDSEIKQNIYLSRDMQEYYFYQQNHKLKEILLKDKINKGQKIKAGFLITCIAKFGMETIYNAMKTSDLFEPEIIVAAPDYGFKTHESFWENALVTYNFYKAKGYNVTFAYDEKTRKAKNITKLYRDILFFNDPQLFHVSNFKNDLFNYNCLTCYLTYAMNIVENFYYHYEYSTINHAWKEFVPTNFDYAKMINESKYKGLNSISLGYPKLDLYAEKINDALIPNKIKNGNKTVIYAPHWSICPPLDRDLKLAKFFNTGLSTFNLYFDLFKNLKDKYKNINWVFKPHPNLGARIIECQNTNGIMTYEDYQNYINEWDNSPNGVYVNSSDYIDLFKYSDLLITDSGSFVGEWLPSCHPCLYLFNPEKKNPRKGFNELGNKILDTYYICNNKDEILNAFENILIKGMDLKKEDRLKVFTEEFSNIGCSGQKIVDYLTEILTN